MPDNTDRATVEGFEREWSTFTQSSAELTAEERSAAIGTITRMLESKSLINNVALTFPLKDIVAAHEAVEQGKAMGNVIVMF